MATGPMKPVAPVRNTRLVKAFDAAAVDAALAESPELLGWRDERGRNWLHLCCATELKGRDPAASVNTADVLLARGLDLADHAFTEGDWKATPVWFCVGRGRNLAVADHLIGRGGDPNFSLWAAAFNDDVPAIDLLVSHGAVVDDPAEASETPFLAAVKWSHFAAAAALARHGADVNIVDPTGMTALHYMLKKSSGLEYFEMLADHGARGDIAGPDGETVAAIMARKRDPAFHLLATRFAG